MTRPCVTIAVLAACLAGCGGGGSAAPYEGTWRADLDANTLIGLTLDNGSYSSSLISLTSANTANMEVETGAYTAAGNTLTLQPQKWTCPGSDPITSVTYSFSGPNLAIAESTGIVVFERNATSGSATGAVQLGCFDANGAFTISPLAPVAN